MRNRVFGVIGMAALAMAAACGKDNKADDALKNDLSLAAQQQPGQLDSLSAAERGLAATKSGATSTAPRRSTTTRRSTSSGSAGSSRSSGTVASSPAPTVEKHTKRDAAIGAAAGAVIGAATSKNKVKGAVIGGAAGGILGAVIGNNVDKTKKKP